MIFVLFLFMNHTLVPSNQVLKEYGASDGDKVVILKTFDEKVASKDVSDLTTAVSTALFPAVSASHFGYMGKMYRVSDDLRSRRFEGDIMG